MTSGFDWSRTQREARLRRWGGEAIDGAPIGHHEKPKGVGQASINGPSNVARGSGNVRSAFLGRVRMAMASGSAMPPTSGLPTNIVREIKAFGGALSWAKIQPDTQQKVEKIKRRLKKKSKK